MVEKQASSEIAERELQRVCEGIESNWPMRGWQIADHIRPLIREAERDTRKRVAQEVKEMSRRWRGQALDVADYIVERIRGKE